MYEDISIEDITFEEIINTTKRAHKWKSPEIDKIKF